jgi:hypothetical protein
MAYHAAMWFYLMNQVDTVCDDCQSWSICAATHDFGDGHASQRHIRTYPST